MRATRFIALTVAILVPALSFSQANWTPNLQQGSALGGVSVKMVTLTPQEAGDHYNIQISKPQQFVMVEGIAEGSVAARRPEAGSGVQPGFDLIDTIILGGEVPQHGNIKDVATFEHLASLCVPGCLVVVRHKAAEKSENHTSDVVWFGLSLVPDLMPSNSKFIVSAHATKLGEKRLKVDWNGFCDTQTRYFYFPGRAENRHDNWLSPEGFETTFGVDRTCENYPFGRAKNVSAKAPAPLKDDSVQDEIQKIRNAPHAAMPPAQAAPAPLGGQTSMTVENGTGYVLYLYLSGPNTQTLQIAAGSSQTLAVSPGSYEIAAKVSDPSVMPFYGRDDYAANTQYSHHFYVSSRPR